MRLVTRRLLAGVASLALVGPYGGSVQAQGVQGDPQYFAPVRCPYDFYGAGDHCDQSPVNPSYAALGPAFPSVAIENVTGVDLANGVQALANLTAHPQHYNVEAWEMGEGYELATVFLDPTNVANLPAGCTVTTNGSASGPNPGGNEVECTNSSAADLHFGALDWSRDGNASHLCYSLFINQLRTGSVYFDGAQKVRMDSECSAAGSTPAHASAMWLKIQGTQPAVVINNLDCDGNARTYKGAFTYNGVSCFLMNSTGANLLEVHHSVFHDQPGRPVVCNGGTGGRLFQNVIVDGMALDSDTAHTHGELVLCVTGSQTINQVTYKDVAFIVRNTSPGGAGTSPDDLSTGGPGGAHVTTATYQRVNAYVNANRNGATQFTYGSAFFSDAYDIMDTLNVGDTDIRNANYFWANGAPQCARMPSRTTTMSAYILNGVLYVVAETGPVNVSAPTGPIMVGESVISSVTTVAGIVQAFGTVDPNTGLASTGTGKTGSYVLTGHSPSNVASVGSPTTAIGVYPTLTTINQGFNYNIQDMSNVTFTYGVGSGVTPPGDYLNPTCTGHF